ncbi:MAG: marine proteobacterial sortase target protein [Xanthomonadales bacterium]|nr:marine proteobacterial sortase target protein [Xanthomonadales bacterium]
MHAPQHRIVHATRRESCDGSPRRPARIRETLERQSRRSHPELHAAHPHRRVCPPDLRRRLAPPRRGMRWQDRVLLGLAVILMTLLLLRVETAQGDAATAGGQPGAQPAEPQAWGLTLLAGHQAMTSLALETSVHAEVNGLLARVHVLQSFRNDSNDWVEGVYRFPLPDGAAVDRLIIQVGDRTLEGEIQERESAERVYQQAREAGQAASLVSQERANQFSTRMANIGPGDTVHVLIGFLARVDYRDGAFRLNLPMTFTPRWGAEAQPGTGLPAPRPQLASFTAMPANDSHRLNLRVDLAAGIPLASLESLHHDVDIQAGEAGYTVTLLNPDEIADRAFELRWMPEFGAQPQSSLVTFDDGQDVYAQLMLLPPRDAALDPAPREVIFVIDTSGSMAGASLDQARAALQVGLDALGPDDRFNLVQFNSITESLFADPVPVTPETLREARQWVKRLEADGGTDMAPALKRALATRPLATPAALTTAAGRADLLRQVVFITDGAVGNERELLLEVADRLGDSRLFTVSIGSAPNGGFMRRAAELGRGHHTHIGRPEDVSRTMTDLWTHIRLPAISDLCIDWGGPAEYYPEVLPDLYAGQPLWVMARLQHRPDLVRLCGTLNDEAWTYDAWPRLQDGSDMLATLWAREKVESLQAGMMFGADSDQARQDIVQVALAHDLLTPWTSLVAVDRTPARPAGEGLARANLPSLLPAGSAVSAGFPATATGWKTQLLLSVLVLGIATTLFLRPFAPLPRLPFRSLVQRYRHRYLVRRTPQPVRP